MRTRKLAGVLAASFVVALHSVGFGKELKGPAKQPFLLPPGMPKPNRICEPIGNVVSPDGKWLAFLRRAEWDERGYRIPYMLTEVWVREVKTGQERRVLDYMRLSSKWTRRLGRRETFFRRAGGFTFRSMSWSPSSKALALQDAGDEQVCWGSVVIDLERDRIIEFEGILTDWSPDGTMLAACSSCALGCPDGLLMADLRSGEVKHHFPDVEIGEGIDFGWHTATEFAFSAFLKGRHGWWKYEPAKGEATLTPLDEATLTPLGVSAIKAEPLPPTWWMLSPGKHPRCEAGPQESTKQPFLLPAGMPKPNRICEPIGNIVSPDGKWLVFLRRAEWDQRGYRIPYMLTEVWVRELKTGQERRVLDYTRLSSKWTRRLGRKETISRAAGGFTFYSMKWSPSWKALALEYGGDEEVCWGSVIIDLERDRIIEIDGIGLDWSPDGTMLAACSSCDSRCPDGLLMVDLRSGEVKHHFPGVEVGFMGRDHGWYSLTEYALAAFLKGRGGWWKYEPAKGEATLTPVYVGGINAKYLPPTQTWWPPKPGKRRRCETGPP